MPLKENIKNCRLANNFTQQQIADALGIDRTAYANYELGHATPSIDVLCKLAKIFGVSLDSLMDYFSDEESLAEKITDERAALLRDAPQAIGYMTPDERQLLLLYRLSKNKPQILDFINKSLHDEEK